MASYGNNQYGARQYGQLEVDGAPALRNRDPAPGDTLVNAEAPIYFEVFQSPSGFQGSTILVYVNGTLIVSGLRALAGFDVTIGTLSDGYSFLISNPSLWETGAQSVRVVAGLPAGQLDEAYSFSTGIFAPTTEDIESVQNQAAGIDLRLSTADHDLFVDAADLVLVAGADEVAQHLGVGLRLFRGEWYLDETAGVPYYQRFFVTAPNTRTIETTLRQELLGDPDVDSLPEFSLELDRGSRKLGVEFVAESVFGEVEVSAVFP
jgi:hypothetical protein